MQAENDRVFLNWTSYPLPRDGLSQFDLGLAVIDRIAECHHVFNEGTKTCHRELNGVDVVDEGAGQQRGLAHQRGMPTDHGKNVVEVMRETAGDDSKGFDPLRVEF